MMTFREYCENRQLQNVRPKAKLRRLGPHPREAGGDRDVEQLRRLGLSRGMSVNKGPNQDSYEPDGMNAEDPYGDDYDFDPVHRHHRSPANSTVDEPDDEDFKEPGEREEGWEDFVPPSPYHEPMPIDQLPPGASPWEDYWHIPPHMKKKQMSDTKSRASGKIRNYLLGRLEDVGGRLGDTSMFQALRSDSSNKVDWLAAADWLEERGEDNAARAFRRYVSSFYS